MVGEYAPQFWAHLARTEQFYATMRNLKLKILWFPTALYTNVPCARVLS